MTKPIAIALAFVLFASSASSRAQTACPVALGSSPELARIDGATRLTFVRGVMRDQARRARLWMWFWGLSGTALAAGNYVIAGLATTKDDAIDPLISGTASLFIPAAILVKPLRVTSDHEALEAYIAQTSTPAGPMEPCLQLALAEELLEASADDEDLGVGFFAHAIAIGGNAGIGLLLGLGFHHWGGALLNGVGGLVISETQIFSQPRGAIRALERYRRGDLPTASASRVTWSVAPLAVGDARGLAIVGAF